jgi:D-glycero-alpha-D-manno-heptose-7-phosphate kinase
MTLAGDQTEAWVEPAKHKPVRARAPLRLGFGGGGTDVSPYCDEHGGIVLNATIDLFAHVNIEPRTDGRVRLVAADKDETWEGEAVCPLALSEPLRLLKGVYNRCMVEFGDGKPMPLTMTTYADCPPGSGLGTSSALVVAMVEALRCYMGVELTPPNLARLAFEIERVDLGLAGGRQDQYAAAYGGLNLMRFQTDGQVLVEPLDAGLDVMRELESSLVLYFTGVSRESAQIIDEQSANMRAKTKASLTGLDALKAGALEMHDALAKGDLPRFGALLDAGWQSKKLTASNISSLDIDRVYDAAKAYGIFGGKVSGAGGGGFMMFLVDPARREGLKRLLNSFGGQVTTAKFRDRGVEAWTAGWHEKRA